MNSMITTMDRAGRLVIPKVMRDAIGMGAGDVQIDVVGSTITISVPPATLVERHGLLMLSDAAGLDDDRGRSLRHGNQR